MVQQVSSNTKLDKAMTTEQFNQVVEAILAGKYSWACLLILRFAGYNPLHYIPYRTYNRLIKDNLPSKDFSKSKTINTKSSNKQNIQTDFHESLGQKCLSKINDLTYLEQVDQQKLEVRGGTLTQCLYSKQEYESIKDYLEQNYQQDFSNRRWPW